MIQTKKVDYLIVGLGLAGACLALQLLRRKKSIVVFDQPQNNHSTSVAAGLINPITGKMLAKTHMADELFPYLFSFYADAEVFLRRKLFHAMPLYRPFGSVEEQNEWMGRSTHESMKPYIESIALKPTYGNDVHDPVGGVLLRQAGYLDTPAFLEGVRSALRETDSYVDAHWEESILEEQSTAVVYRSWQAERVIYCGGVDDLKSRYFSSVPIKPLKGETLQITMQAVPRIYNRGVYVVPAAREGTFHVGATYDFDLTPSTTEHGRAELEEKLRELLVIPYQVVGQNWGIRPTTIDRRPILGAAPNHEKIVIFNGFGTKGVSQAPYFSGHLTAWLEGHGEIMREVNIRRFKSLYSKFD